MTSQRRRAVAADCNTTVDATPTAPELIAALSYDDVSVAASQSLRLEHRSTKVLIAISAASGMHRQRECNLCAMASRGRVRRQPTLQHATDSDRVTRIASMTTKH